MPLVYEPKHILTQRAYLFVHKIELTQKPFRKLYILLNIIATKVNCIPTLLVIGGSMYTTNCMAKIRSRKDAAL